MDIDVKLLTDAMNEVVKYLRTFDLDKIKVIDDFYLDFSDERFGLEKKSEEELKKAEVCIGSIYDDVEELTYDIEKSSNEINMVSIVTIDRLAHILEYITYYIRKEIFKLDL